MFLDHSMCTVLKKLNLTLGVIQKVRSLRRGGKGGGGGCLKSVQKQTGGGGPRFST